MAIKKSISMPKIMFYNAVRRARHLGFTQFSDYIQDLMRRDTTPGATPQTAVTE